MEIKADGVLLKFDKDDVIKWLNHMNITSYYSLEQYMKDAIDYFCEIPNWGAKYEELFEDGRIKKG